MTDDDCGEWKCRRCDWMSGTWWAECERCGARFTLQWEPAPCDEEDVEWE